MRFSYQLCGCFAAVWLLCAAAPAGTVIVVPDAQYSVDASSSFCAGFNCSIFYGRQVTAVVPTTLQVGCSADVGAPNCAGAELVAAPAPYLSAGATTSLNRTSQGSVADATVTYYYQILCDKCSPGTIVPMSIGGVMEAHYVPGTGGTVTFGDLGRAFVNGYDPLTSTDNVLIDEVMVGLGATAGGQSSLGPPVSPPSGFGFCESTWTGFSNCTGGPSSPYGVPFEARVGTVYSIFLDANASVTATNQPFSTSSAEVTVDPVLSFGPGFDSTGYSIAESPGIGNEASTVPEPATWMLLSTAVLGWGCARRLRRTASKRGGVL